MPSTGLLPFLLPIQNSLLVLTASVNALNGLTSISTYDRYIGNVALMLCQCPQRAYFHFYTVKVAKGISYKVVSMPSTGLLPFLLKKEEEKKIAEIVSMPSTGLLPFLRKRGKNE